MKFLPQQKNFKKEIKDNLRYKRISECLKSKFTVPYLSFVVFIIIDFENFLITFQSNTPIILLLHNKSVTLLKKLTTKFRDFNMLTFFFLCGQSLTSIYESQDCKGREGISLTSHYHLHRRHRYYTLAGQG